MSFWQTYYHLVWATKNRAELITPQVEAVLYPYMRRKAKQLEIIVYALDGWTDHVHLVAGIPPKLAVAEAMKSLKGASAHQVNLRDVCGGEKFVWQIGYGVMTLGHTQLDKAVAYVENQKQHHAAQSTNAWLEYSAEQKAAAATSVAESGSIYTADPYPF